MKYLFQILLALALTLFLTGCPQESDSLVNPLPQSELVNVRLINLSDANQALSLSMEYQNVKSTEFIPKYFSTECIHPPFDSANVSLVSNQGIEFTQTRKVRFARNLNYTLVALPSAPGDSLNRKLDTLIVFSNSSTIDRLSNDSYIKVFNAVPNLNITFNLYEGCPGGKLIAGFLPYRRYSGQSNVVSGINTFSLTVKENNNETVIGTFDANLKAIGQYTFFVVNSNSGYELYLLNEDELTSNAFIKLNKSLTPETNVRLVNFSRKPITLSKKDNFGDDILAQNLNTKSVSEYNTISSCTSELADVFELQQDSKSSTFSHNFLVSSRNTVVFADSSDNGGVLKYIVEPQKIFDTTQQSKAKIRVLNANYKYDGLTLSIGANKYSIRLNNNDEKIRKYASGVTIASQMPLGATSGTVLVQPGLLPLTLFTSTQPSKFITGSVINIEQNKSYIIILSHSNGVDEISVIEENEVNINVSPEKQGVFIQIVNAVDDDKNINVSINTTSGNLVSSGLLSKSNSIGTLIEVGNHELEIQGKKIEINAILNKRVLVFITGSSDNPDIFPIAGNPMGTDVGIYKRRFFNASKSLPQIDVRLSENVANEIEGLEYGTLSDILFYNKDDRLNFFFYNTLDFTLKFRVDDLKFNLGKNYILIFAGKQNVPNKITNNGFSVIVLQEF